MKPTPQDLHVDALLTSISIAYRNTLYIADRVAPIVQVQKQSDVYPVFSKADWMRDEAMVREAGTEAAEGGYEVTTNNTYFARKWAIKKKIPDEARANADPVFRLDIEATEYVSDRLDLRKEVQLASEIFKTGVWGTDVTLTGAQQWNDYANSDPVGDIRKGIRTVQQAIGRPANTVVMGKEVFDILVDHPDILERFKYTSAQSVNEEMLARLFGVDRVLVGGAVRNTANEGQAANMAFVWGKHCLILFVPNSPSLLTPAAVYIFRWGTRQIRRYREEKIKSDWVEGEEAWDMKVTAPDAGYFIQNAVA